MTGIDEARTREAAAELVALHRGLVASGQRDVWPRVIARAMALAVDGDVHPGVLGELYERCLADPERHARGVHFTGERELAGVIEPTIVGPWRRRIAGAKQEQLTRLHASLCEFVVLDPACGSGNFLYAAFVALKGIEAELVARLRGLGVTVQGGVTVRQCRGIDRSEVAAELARVTLRIAARRFGGGGEGDEEVDVVVGDALFMAWGEVDAIVGNPPFVAKNKLAPELGRVYVERLRAAYPGVPGRADYCVYFFRRAHEALRSGGRAGMIGTNTIRQNDSRVGGLQYIVENGGCIVDAVATRVWPGEASVHVSVVNWVKGETDEVRVLRRQVGDKFDGAWQRVDVGSIGASLSERDMTSAVELGCVIKPKNFFQGQTLGCDGFLLDWDEAAEIGRDEAARGWVLPYLNGVELLGKGGGMRLTIDVSDVEDVRIITKCRGVYRWIEQRVLPEVRRKAAAEPGDVQRQAQLGRWWKFWRARPELLARLAGLRRYIVCVRVTRRPIFVFVDAGIRPSDALQAFTFDDDYSFGVLQSRLHWEWFVERCSTLKADYRYTSETVWSSFPWPQAPTVAAVRAVAEAARQLRAARAAGVEALGSLRAVYRALERPGANELLMRGQDALDAAVRDAYGMAAGADGLTALLRLNAEVAAAERAGLPVQGPGLPDAMVGDPAVRSEDRLVAKFPWDVGR